MTTLVTGATGFVGSSVVKALLARGEPVRVLIRAGSNRRSLRNLPVETVVGDLEQPSTLRRAVAGSPVALSCCGRLPALGAAPGRDVPHQRRRHAGPAARRRDAGVARIVYTSSVATLGLKPDGRPADETTPAKIDDMSGRYKRSKYLAEQAVHELIEREGLAVVIVNPAAPMGPGDARPTPTGRVLLEAAKGRIPAFVDTGLNVVHVDDVAAGHLLAYERGAIGERYILGGQNVTLAEILTMVALLAGRRPPRLRLPAGLLLPIAYLSEMAARLTRGGEPLLTVDGLRMASGCTFPPLRPSVSSAIAAGLPRTRCETHSTGIAATAISPTYPRSPHPRPPRPNSRPAHVKCSSWLPMR